MAHVGYTIKVEDDLIYVTIIDLVNIEILRMLHHDLKGILANKKMPKDILVNLYGEGMPLPGVAEESARLYRDLPYGRVARFSESEPRRQAARDAARLSGKPDRMKTFENEEDARVWLKNK
jgi:hypothetical protein